MKKTLVVLASVIVVLLAGILVLFLMIRSRTTGGQSGGGAPVVINMPTPGMNLNIFDGVLHLRNFTLLNPADFREKTFVSLPEVYVSVDTATLTGQGTKHIRELRVNIATVMAIRRKDGKYNFEWILHQKKAQKKAGEKAREQKTKVRIDRLHVVFGNIVFMDYTVRGGKPLMVRFDVNLDKTYRNIRDLDELSKAVSKDFLDKISIGDIKNFEVKDLPDITRSALAAIPDETKDRLFGTGKDRDRVIKELSHRFANKIKGKK